MDTINYNQGPPDPSPEERLFMLNEDSWEDFIYDCVDQLKSEKKYIKVQKLGGAGDKGRDICGYTEELPTEKSWDLYQAKYYKQSFSPSLFISDIAKFIYFVFNEDFTLPKNYFVCPLILGTSLFDLLQNPQKMKDWFIEELKKKKGEFSSYKLSVNSEILDFINQFDFSVFKPLNTSELLNIHSRNTQKHWNVFRVLAHRQPNPDVPNSICKKEQIYVNELLNVYNEKLKSKITDTSKLSDTRYNSHFVVQRKLFYCAEGLKLFSRDNLPGAFDSLLEELELGLSTEYISEHEDGLTKVNSVLKTANTVPVSNNPLSKRLQAGDLQGSCHHIVNNEKWKWIDE